MSLARQLQHSAGSTAQLLAAVDQHRSRLGLEEVAAALTGRAVLSRIWPTVVVANARLDAAEAARALESLARPRHAGLVLELLRRFLRDAEGA